MVKKLKQIIDPQLEFVEQSAAMALTQKAKISLYKKSKKSGISVNILEEVYQRGYHIWSNQFKGSREQFAFDRVNSFIAGGFASQIDKDLREGSACPCDREDGSGSLTDTYKKDTPGENPKKTIKTIRKVLNAK